MSQVDRERRRARRVCYGLVGFLVAWAVTDVDFWPMTAYRLFSEVRTDQATSTQLVAMFDDGTEQVVFPGASEVASTSWRGYATLPDADDFERDAMLDYWFENAEIESDRVSAVRLQESTRVLDRTTLEWSTVSSTVVWEESL